MYKEKKLVESFLNLTQMKNINRLTAADHKLSVSL